MNPDPTSKEGAGDAARPIKQNPAPKCLVCGNAARTHWFQPQGGPRYPFCDTHWAEGVAWEVCPDGRTHLVRVGNRRIAYPPAP